MRKLNSIEGSYSLACSLYDDILKNPIHEQNVRKMPSICKEKCWTNSMIRVFIIKERGSAPPVKSIERAFLILNTGKYERRNENSYIF